MDDKFLKSVPIGLSTVQSWDDLNKKRLFVLCDEVEVSEDFGVLSKR
jgi:hypothetical protein